MRVGPCERHYQRGSVSPFLHRALQKPTMLAPQSQTSSSLISPPPPSALYLPTWGLSLALSLKDIPSLKCPALPSLHTSKSYPPSKPTSGPPSRRGRPLGLDVKITLPPPVAPALPGQFQASVATCYLCSKHPNILGGRNHLSPTWKPGDSGSLSPHSHPASRYDTLPFQGTLNPGGVTGSHVAQPSQSFLGASMIPVLAPPASTLRSSVLWTCSRILPPGPPENCDIAAFVPEFAWPDHVLLHECLSQLPLCTESSLRVGTVPFFTPSSALTPKATEHWSIYRAEVLTNHSEAAVMSSLTSLSTERST